MAIFYIVGALIIIITKINMLPWALEEIFRSAFPEGLLLVDLPGPL
jgi:Na+/alanine symporter